jgi:hypothetical protein
MLGGGCERAGEGVSGVEALEGREAEVRPCVWGQANVRVRWVSLENEPSDSSERMGSETCRERGARRWERNGRGGGCGVAVDGVGDLVGVFGIGSGATTCGVDAGEAGWGILRAETSTLLYLSGFGIADFDIGVSFFLPNQLVVLNLPKRFGSLRGVWPEEGDAPRGAHGQSEPLSNDQCTGTGS